MNTSFQQKSVGRTDEWYTPKSIIEALGHFDLDPCSPVNRPFDIADKHITKEEDGLKYDWGGKRVFLNPPYSRPLIDLFMKKMVENNNGIALTFDRCDNRMFQDVIFPNASGILFIKGRIKFLTEDGSENGTPGCGSVLIAFGDENARILKDCAIKGCYFDKGYV